MSEHYPVRQVIDVGGYSNGYPATATFTKEVVFCGCTEAYDFEYGHEETP